VRFSVVLAHTHLLCRQLSCPLRSSSKKGMYARQTGQQTPCHSHSARFNGRRSDAKQRSIDSLTTAWPFLTLGSIRTARPAICQHAGLFRVPRHGWVVCPFRDKPYSGVCLRPLQNVFEPKTWVPGGIGSESLSYCAGRTGRTAY
jgi:hypothetical protein